MSEVVKEVGVELREQTVVESGFCGPLVPLEDTPWGRELGLRDLKKELSPKDYGRAVVRAWRVLAFLE